MGGYTSEDADDRMARARTKGTPANEEAEAERVLEAAGRAKAPPRPLGKRASDKGRG